MYLYAVEMNWTSGRHSYNQSNDLSVHISLPQGIFKSVATAASFLLTINKYILLSTAACFSGSFLLDSCIKLLFNFQ